MFCLNYASAFSPRVQLIRVFAERVVTLRFVFFLFRYIRNDRRVSNAGQDVTRHANSHIKRQEKRINVSC